MCHRSSAQRVLRVGFCMAASLAELASSLAELLSLEQHVVWISVALLPLLAQPSKSCPVILLPVVQGFDQLEIDASTRFFDHHLELPQECGAKEWQPLKPPEIGEDTFKCLIEAEQRLVGVEFLRSRFHAATSSSAFAVSSVRPGLKCSRCPLRSSSSRQYSSSASNCSSAMPASS